MRLQLIRSKKAARLLAEIAVVVLGILIAFGLEAAWERRGTRADERAHLRALASDFAQNVERLQRHVEQEERISARSRELLTLARSPEPAPTDSVFKLLGGVFNSGRYEPVTGAYEALVNSAGLTLIRDDSLRASLAEFHSRVNGRYAERFSDELYFAFVRDFAGQLPFFVDALSNTRDSAAYASLLSNPKFREYLALRYLSERDVARHYRELLLQAEAIRERIGSALD